MVVATSGREISAEILESCRRGDREAFRALYEAYKDKVYSIALYYFHGDAVRGQRCHATGVLKVDSGYRAVSRGLGVLRPGCTGW